MQVVETELSRGGLRNHGTLALSPLQNRLPGVFPFKHHSALRVDATHLSTRMIPDGGASRKGKQ